MDIAEAITPPAAFRTFILRTTQMMLDTVQTAETTLSADIRQQALHTLSFSIKLDEAWSLTRQLLLTLAPKMELLGHRYDWMPYLERGIELSLQRGDVHSAAEYELQLGTLYRMVSEFERAKKHVEDCLMHFVLACDRQGQARGLNELGWIEHLQHRYEAATRHAEEALNLLEEDDPERGMSYRVLGMVNFVQGHWSKAEAYHRQSSGYFYQDNNQRKLSWTLQNLANAIRRQGRYAEAIPLFHNAATILETLADQYHWAIVQMNLGGVLFESQQYEQALTHYQLARSVFQHLTDKFNLANIDTGLGLSYQGLKQYAFSERAFISSAEQFESLGYLNWQVNALDGLAHTYMLWGKHSAARQTVELALSKLAMLTSAPNYEYLAQSLQSKKSELSPE